MQRMTELQKIHLNNLCQYQLCNFTVENVRLEAWTYEYSSLLCSCNYKESGAPVRGDSLEVSLFTLWTPISFCQPRSNPRVWNSKTFLICDILILQRCNLPNPDAKQRSCICNLYPGNVTMQIVFTQARCWGVTHNVFIDKALVHWGNIGIHDSFPKSPVSFRTEVLFTMDSGFNKAKSSHWLSVENMDGTIGCVKKSFERGDTSVMPE